MRPQWADASVVKVLVKNILIGLKQSRMLFIHSLNFTIKSKSSITFYDKKICGYLDNLVNPVNPPINLTAHTVLQFTGLIKYIDNH
ncbi:hypothetical protein RCL_jg23167.t1 [Rhizophagus clarus]|uniref:Uncharacterized protein n=1 Tax=Rhizophagus clarus TaxID=94130 RepID=A0A8H3QFZ0_9GLOM|nr:hypothetical protein RCL_jg23167.t1 [Rhizophagus clarus]